VEGNTGLGAKVNPIGDCRNHYLIGFNHQKYFLLFRKENYWILRGETPNGKNNNNPFKDNNKQVPIFK